MLPTVLQASARLRYPSLREPLSSVCVGAGALLRPLRGQTGAAFFFEEVLAPGGQAVGRFRTAFSLPSPDPRAPCRACLSPLNDPPSHLSTWQAACSTLLSCLQARWRRYTAWGQTISLLSAEWRAADC